MNNYEPVDERIIASAFFDFMHQHGVIPRGNLSLIMDGRIHRFSTENDKHGGQSGAYFLYSDGCPNGGAMDYHIHSEMQKFKLNQDIMHNDNRRVLSEAEYRKKKDDDELKKAESERKKQENMRLQKEKQMLATLNAWREFSCALPLPYPESHAYLTRKHVQNFTSCDIRLRIKRKKETDDICNVGDLLIPVVDVRTDKFISLIHISEKEPHTKLNYTGARILGGCVQLIPRGLRESFCIAPDSNFINPEINSDTALICEGVATGYSVLELSQHKVPVLCVGGCGNMIHVCKAWHERYPKMRIILCPDNDENGIGLRKAQECRDAGCAHDIKLPQIKGKNWRGDWNDLLTYMKGFDHE